MNKPDSLTFQTIDTDGVPSASPQARLFRDAMGGFATGVSVVTSLGENGERIGLTVNSFASLSIDPPLVIWNLSNDSGLVSHFNKGRRFNIIFLSDGQKDLALKFARADEERYQGLEAPASEDGVPLLYGSAGALECQIEGTHAGGDHMILIGRVLQFALSDKEPLLFHRGKFRHF